MNTFLGFPENDLNQKYVHFTVFEKNYKLYFEAEDRNRFYFWSTSPFYSIKFFEYAIAIPDCYKEHLDLYRMFLERLDKNCLEVSYANWPRIGLLPVSLSYRLLPRFQEIASRYFSLLPRKMQNIARMVGKEDLKYDPNEKIENYQQIRVPSYLGELMSLYQVKRLLEDDLNDGRFFSLISIILYALNLEDKQRRADCIILGTGYTSSNISI